MVVTAVVTGLHGPLVEQLATHRPVGPFHDSHIWSFHHLARMLQGDVCFSTVTDRIGFPDRAEVRFIAWLPAVMAAPLQGILGPLGAYDILLLAGPGLSGVAALLWLVFGFRARLPVAAPAACTYALCPFALGSLANGQIAKVQHGLLPLALLALSWAVRGPRRGWALLAVLVVGLTSTFTVPSLTLYLPLVAVPWVLLEARRSRSPGPGGLRPLAFAGLALVVTAISLWPGSRYYGDLRGGGDGIPAFEPRTADANRLPWPTPSAQPEGLVLGQGSLAHDLHQSSHVAYLGLPLLLGAALLSLRRYPGRGWAWGLVAGGTVLALGPRLISGDAFFTWHGYTFALPARLLDRFGYPTVNSGMYYRAVVIASLGLAAAWAGALSSRMPSGGAGSRGARTRGPWLKRAWISAAWLGALLHMADGIRVTRALWPRPSAPVAGREVLEEMARDPVPGAVLVLPLEHGTLEGGERLLAAVFHRRPTTALPRQARAYLPRVARLKALWDRVERTDDPEAARTLLAGSGFRYVTWRPHRDRDHVHDLPDLTRALGAPDLGDAALYGWRLPGSGRPDAHRSLGLRGEVP